jgi:ribonuclease PH
MRVRRSVDFVGHLPDRHLAAALAAADVVAVPSRYEPFGIVALEAAIAGTPLVVAETGGLRDLAAAGVAAASFPAGDPVALADAIGKVPGLTPTTVLRDCVAAISVGIVSGTALLDLNYPEDSTAEVDMNVVMTGRGEFVEVQGTAEQVPFDRGRLDALLALAERGIRQLVALQRRALDARGEKTFKI